MNGVGSLAKLFKDRISGFVDIIDVIANAARQGIGAAAAKQEVIANTAGDLIAALTAVDDIVARTAIDLDAVRAGYRQAVVTAAKADGLNVTDVERISCITQDQAVITVLVAKSGH